MEAYSQLFTKNGAEWQIDSIPLLITDYPDFPYRGVMIDTARHFLSVESIVQLIYSMMYNKLNVLHWHIADDESFPLQLKTYPDMANYSKYGPKLFYSYEDVDYIVQVGLFAGVRVIPEIPTPNFAFSWSYQQNISDIVLKCREPTYGQLDPTMNLTYQVVGNIFQELNSLFIDKYINFGGDPVAESCFD